MAINAKVLDDFNKDDWGGGLTEKPAMMLTYIAYECYLGNPPERKYLESIFFDTSKKRGRSGLGNGLSKIRTAVGDNNVIRDGEVFEIDTSNLYFDFLEFDKRFASGDFEEVVKLYKRDFCSFYYNKPNRTKELDRWIEEKQQKFREDFVKAVIGAAKRHFLKGDFKAASALSTLNFGINEF